MEKPYPDKKMMTLEQLPNGKEAVITQVNPGHGLRRRMCSMNIREGKTIKKIISQPFWGPIIILIDNRQCAVGRGMARKIWVEEK